MEVHNMSLSWSHTLNSPSNLFCYLNDVVFVDQEAFSYKVAARPERRRRFQDELVMSIGLALDLLTYCLNVTKFQEQVYDPLTFVYREKGV